MYLTIPSLRASSAENFLAVYTSSLTRLSLPTTFGSLWRVPTSAARPMSTSYRERERLEPSSKWSLNFIYTVSQPTGLYYTTIPSEDTCPQGKAAINLIPCEDTCPQGKAAISLIPSEDTCPQGKAAISLIPSEERHFMLHYLSSGESMGTTISNLQNLYRWPVSGLYSWGSSGDVPNLLYSTETLPLWRFIKKRELKGSWNCKYHISRYMWKWKSHSPWFGTRRHWNTA